MDYQAPAIPLDSSTALTGTSVVVDNNHNPAKRKQGRIGPDGLTKDQRYYRKQKSKLEEEQRKRREQGLPPIPAPVCVKCRKNLSVGADQTPVMAVTQASDAGCSPHSTHLPSGESTSTSTDTSPARTLTKLADKSHLEQIGTKIKNLDWLLSIHAYTVTWSSSWGGIDQWYENIDGFYQKAKIQGQDEVDRCILALSRKASRGREILKELHIWLDASKPQDPVLLRTVFQEVWKMKMLVMSGIEYIDLRLSDGPIGYPGVAERLEELWVERYLTSMEVLNEDQENTTEE